MSEAIESKPATEYAKPGATENLNGALTMVDGALIFIALMANRGDLAALALFGIAVGSVTCLRMVDARYRQSQKSKNTVMGDDFGEDPGFKGV